jgi:hypothetical protein
MAVNCCNGCVAPKRHPGCHASCPKYIAVKAAHDRRKAEHEKSGQISGAIYGERSKKVYNAMKDRRSKKV